MNEILGTVPIGGVEGQINAGRDLTIESQSNSEYWVSSTAGVAPSRSPQATGTEHQFEGRRFGIGVSGDGAINYIREDSQAFIRDIQIVNARKIRVDANTASLALAGTARLAFLISWESLHRGHAIT